VLDWLDQPTRIALRQVVRFPLRSALTTAGVAMAVGLLVMALQWTDSIDRVAQVYFYDGQRQNMVLGFSEPQASTVVNDVKRLPGVLAAEPMRIVGADFSVGTRRHRGSITGLPRDARLQPIHDDVSNEDLRVPAGGLMLATHLAAKLGVGPGDQVWVDVLEGRRPTGHMPVAGVFETTIAMPAYMDLDALNRLLLVRPSVDWPTALRSRSFSPCSRSCRRSAQSC
jgi:putative ABC transport system permease protein